MDGGDGTPGHDSAGCVADLSGDSAGLAWPAGKLVRAQYRLARERFRESPIDSPMSALRPPPGGFPESADLSRTRCILSNRKNYTSPRAPWSARGVLIRRVRTRCRSVHQAEREQISSGSDRDVLPAANAEGHRRCLEVAAIEKCQRALAALLSSPTRSPSSWAENTFPAVETVPAHINVGPGIGNSQRNLPV